MKAMETLHDLIEEAKVRAVWWMLCIFAVSYFLTHTSKSMWMNVPISILMLFGLRLLFNEVDFKWKGRNVRQQTYLSHLEKKQLPLNDSRLSTSAPPKKWKRKIDSPVVEAAMEDFINKILQDFIVDLWYSDITSDKEAPEHIYAIIMDVLGEISGRVKEINLVDLLTRDVVYLIGDHLDLFRRNQIAIGVDVMGTLSSEERDERLKHHLMASKELHPALISAESECKVLRRLMGGVLAVVLRPREAHCPVVRSIARELLTCLVMQPVMNFASPAYINELLEYIFLAMKDEGVKEASENQSKSVVISENSQNVDATSMKMPSSNQTAVTTLSRVENQKDLSLESDEILEDPIKIKSADWARVLEAASQRRTEVLTPENLENMWTKGRNYQKKAQKNARKKLQEMPPRPYLDTQLSDQIDKSIPKLSSSLLPSNNLTRSEYQVSGGTKNRLKRSNSTSDLTVATKSDVFPIEGGGPVISEFYTADIRRHNEVDSVRSNPDVMLYNEGLVSKLKCRVIGAHFEKIGSTSFAVYSIAVSDADKSTWFVKRRYRNFERLHRQLKEIPNYTLHLPPKRIFSSSTEDAFVHQRCIQLDKYLQDLLSIANVAEQHEVWDFLSNSSKNYSFGKSSSVMRTLAVNVDDAMDDIVRQFKGVSGGLMRKVVGPTSIPYESDSPLSASNFSTVPPDEINKQLVLRQNTADSTNSLSDNEEPDKNIIEDIGSSSQASGWHSDNELNLKGFLKDDNDEFKATESALLAQSRSLDSIGVPPEWTPPNLSVPVLNLVDNIFQLKRRGWLRRQVFWISKQILQLMMEDAIDDWLLRQIHWLRKDYVIAQGIRWIQDVLWPDGKFFLKLSSQSETNDVESSTSLSQTTNQSSRTKFSKPGYFEQQLEAARRASNVKKMIFDGAPATLVSLIGHKQYKRCAKDIYYFLQSTTCLKQLAYGILELVLVSLFPELRDLILDVHHTVPE
jgi:sorting nexin-13